MILVDHAKNTKPLLLCKYCGKLLDDHSLPHPHISMHSASIQKVIIERSLLTHAYSGISLHAHTETIIF